MNKKTYLIKNVYRGMTLRRVMFHWWLMDRGGEFTGTVLDLGAKWSDRLRPFIKDEVKVIATDLKAAEGVDAVDLNKPLPYADNSMDVVTLFWVIHILENRVLSLREIYRVLKPGGKLYLATPFVSAEVAEPYDYAHLAYDGINKELSEAGFTNINIHRSGGRATSAAVILHPYFIFNTVRVLVFALCLWLDGLTKNRDTQHPTPHSYFATATKK